MAITPYKHIDHGDLAKAFKLAGSNRRSIDRNDYTKVVREMETQLSIVPAHRSVDDNDISTLIVKQQGVQAADVTAPAFTVLDPADNATAVAVSKQPGVTFGENIVFGATGSFTLRKTAGDVLVEVFDVATDQGSGVGQCEIVANKVILHPAVAMTAATQHYITWTAGAVRDLAGNNCVAQASTTVWSFTTA